ncbi:nucleolar complex protein 3 homolog [Diorhabda carinulata]|uniref:nucleolar complex protein 3 homolog n=1 Tax=Diorhabda carinulata TaxID=1163345 RepID=UPI0025A14AA5|nr:nucleolar complex protein 3 homolog [Diorhabda carinulata]
MVVKTKISKIKKGNPKTNKHVNKGNIKKTKHVKINNLNSLPNKQKPKPVENYSEDSDQGEDMLDMVDKDDINFLKSAITNRSYNIFNKIKFSSSEGPKLKRRKVVNDESLENQYEDQMDEHEPDKKIKTLLPIKTKNGIIPQQIFEENDDAYEEENEVAEEEKVDAEEQEDAEEKFSLENTELEFSGPISATQLLSKRNELINKIKIHIGTLSSGLLENPEEKVTNLRTLLSLMEDETAQLYVSVKKLILVSLLEIFKDILPSYEIKHVNTEGVKLKKDTLKLQKYEDTLLLYYKKYLQKLEKCSLVLINKKGDSRTRTEDELKLGILAVQAMCELLITHPYFNYSPNIAQAIVPFLNNHDKNVRDIVKTSIKTIFKEDKKEELTLKILRLINNYLKKHAHINPDMLEVLLVLNLKDINLDQEKQQEVKEKKLLSRKSRILQLSKKEKKRKKKLMEVEKELLETKAEENKQAKHKNLTEITKIVFNIYFRILKNSNNTKTLGVCLEGLAKYAHCINLEFYVDIVNVLDNLLKEDWLGYREHLHCIQTVFAILGGQGEALNLDPLRFYNGLYKELLNINVSSKNSENILILIRTLSEALIKRRKKITNKRILGFIKRLSQLCLQLAHDGTLGCLGIIKSLIQLSRSTDILLDLDPTTGEGKYNPEIDDPEYSNAWSSALYELLYLTRHYHPIVGKFARNIANGAPSTGEASLPGEYNKSTAEQLFTDFSMSEMAFNPPVPPPKKEQPKNKSKTGFFADSSFEDECRNIMRRPVKRKAFWIDI